MVSVKHEPFHLLFGDLTVKWTWKESELLRFRELWHAGDHISDIAKTFKTNKRSIALLVMDQAEQSEIAERTGGLFGH